MLSRTLYSLLLLLSLLRAFLRKEWAALAVMTGQFALLNIRSVPGWLLIAPFVWFLAVGILITRLGLLARISFFLLVGFILYAPLTFDFARWYASYSAATRVLVRLFTLFAFKTALGGRKLFKTDLFEK